jgi:hypothetical protein
MRIHPIPIALAAALLAGASLTGCRQQPADEQAEIRENLEEKGPSAVVSEAARTADFEPPEDGKLTEDQVAMYVEVRGREKQILATAAEDLETRAPAGEGAAADAEAPKAEQQAQAPGQPETEVTVEEIAAPPRDVAQLATADVRAAQELGHDPLEYQWVKGQVLQAQMALYTDNWRQLEESGREKMLETLQRMQDVAGTPAEEGMIERKIEELRSPEASPQETTEAVRHNMQLVRDHQSEILALERWPEMAAAGESPVGAGPAGASSSGSR